MTTRHFPRRCFVCFVLLGPLLTCTCPSALAKRKDVVVMNFVETEYVSGNIGLDWDQVQSVQTTATYRIVPNNGKRLDGKIEKESSAKAKAADFLIREATEEVAVPSASVATIETKKPTF